MNKEKVLEIYNKGLLDGLQMAVEGVNELIIYHNIKGATK